MSNFHERLKLLIKQNNCKYLSIEQATGIKHYTISTYVNGTVEPDVESIIKLSKYFNVSSDYLVGHIDTIYPKHVNDTYEKLKTLVLEDIEEFRKELIKFKNSNKHYITK